jgi:molybdopterin-guanine dinucleotide biosynthesis protein B
LKKFFQEKKIRTDCVLDRSKQLTLKIDGKEIKIVPFVQNTFKDVILGFVKNLKGYKKGKIEIEIDE